MNPDNEASRLKRELLVELAKAVLEGGPEGIDRIPHRLFPRERRSVRCCIYRDRAIVRYRLMAQLGFSVEEETDDSKPLSAYAAEALARPDPPGDAAEPCLTVIDEACNSCVKARFQVTNLCQGCLARPCTSACRKGAIAVDGKASIDEENCVNCGLCMAACPYHAIVKLTVPCEEACPVDAISKDADGKEHIDYAKCVYCGRCMAECPFGAVTERSRMVDVLARLSGERREEMVALYAPALAVQFPSAREKLEAALRLLGFSGVVEVARGAEITAEREAAELAERMEGGGGLLTTSCCPAYVRTARLHVPEIAPRLSSSLSPMLYAAELARKERPGAKLVFIGPCVAKRKEALDSGAIDYVLTAEELGAMLVAAGIDLDSVEAPPSAREAPDASRWAGRGFPVSGGVSRAVASRMGGRKFEAALIDGLDRKSIALLRLYGTGRMKADLLEVMACRGGCVAGPAVLANPKLAARALEDLVEKSKPASEGGDGAQGPQ